MNSLFAFFLGQISIVLLIFAFINFFIFGEPPLPPNSSKPYGGRPRSNSTRAYLSSSSLLLTQRRRRQSAVLRPQPAISTKTILKKTYYNVSGHQPESLDWFNVLIAQTIAQLRAEAQHDGQILGTLNTALNGKWKPSFLGDINVTEVNLGEEFPIFSNCRVIPVQEDGGDAKVGEGQAPSVEGTRLQARLDMDLNDLITLGIETKLVLNYPKPVVAVLPVALAVSVVRFRGTLSLSFVPSPLPLNNPPLSAGQPFPTTLEFSFLPDYDLELSVRSLVGSRSRLQDLPKIAQLVEARLRAWFDERCVEPRVQQIVLPNFWPRKKNTRGGDAADDEQTIDESETEREDEGRKVSGGTKKSANASASAERPAGSLPGSDPRGDARMVEEGRKLREAMASHRRPYKQDPP